MHKYFDLLDCCRSSSSRPRSRAPPVVEIVEIPTRIRESPGNTPLWRQDTPEAAA